MIRKLERIALLFILHSLAFVLAQQQNITISHVGVEDNNNVSPINHKERIATKHHGIMVSSKVMGRRLKGNRYSRNLDESASMKKRGQRINKRKKKSKSSTKKYKKLIKLRGSIIDSNTRTNESVHRSNLKSVERTETSRSMNLFLDANNDNITPITQKLKTTWTFRFSDEMDPKRKATTEEITKLETFLDEYILAVLIDEYSNLISADTIELQSKNAPLKSELQIDVVTSIIMDPGSTIPSVPAIALVLVMKDLTIFKERYLWTKSHNDIWYYTKSILFHVDFTDDKDERAEEVKVVDHDEEEQQQAQKVEDVAVDTEHSIFRSEIHRSKQGENIKDVLKKKSTKNSESTTKISNVKSIGLQQKAIISRNSQKRSKTITLRSDLTEHDEQQSFKVDVPKNKTIAVVPENVMTTLPPSILVPSGDGIEYDNECPPNEPFSGTVACSEDQVCKYGKECCYKPYPDIYSDNCTQSTQLCSHEVECMCYDGYFVCFFTEFCIFSVCRDNEGANTDSIDTNKNEMESIITVPPSLLMTDQPSLLITNLPSLQAENVTTTTSTTPFLIPYIQCQSDGDCRDDNFICKDQECVFAQR